MPFESSFFDKNTIINYIFYQMLHERTSSAINLRMQNSRRHTIRNLKAKVRSLLPVDICPREKKRCRRNEKLSNFKHLNIHDFQEHPHAHIEDKKKSKIFQKLSRKQIEEINQNKHYFLGNQESIAYYENYLREQYPELVENQWSTPHTLNKHFLPFAFIPSNLINPQQLPTYKKIASEKKMFDKRSSGCKSVGLFRKESVPFIEERTGERGQSRLSKNKADACLSRKQAKQQEQKIKRQINSVHLQRQQKQAEEKRQKILKQKINNAKYRFTSSHMDRYQKKTWAQDKFVQNDIVNLAAKLRKVCLHRKKQLVKDPII